MEPDELDDLTYWDIVEMGVIYETPGDYDEYESEEVEFDDE